MKVITALADQKNLERSAGVQNLCERPIKFSVVYINKVSCLRDTVRDRIKWLCDTVPGIALNDGLSKCCCFPLGVIMVALEMLHGMHQTLKVIQMI